MGLDKPDIIGKMQSSQPSNNIVSLLKEIRDNTKNLSGGKEKQDFRRKEDQSKYVDELEPLLEAQLKLQKENLGLQKDQKKKEGKGLLGLFGGLAFFAKAAGALTVGGLIGFILTGKQEFLFSVIKGFKKLFFDIPRQIFKMGGLIIKGLRGVFNIGKIIKKGGVVKALRKTALGRIGRVAGRKGIKAAGTYALKSMGKAIVKGGSKQVLKKIPVVGTLLGLFFAIQRFQKGDVVGGLLEIASGLSSLVNFIIPGGGLALGLLIDGILLFRDAKGAMKPQAPKETKPPKKVNKTEVNKIPIIGGFVAMFDAIKMVFGGDIIRGTKLFFVGMARTFPVPGMSFLLNKFVFPMIDATAHLFKISETVIGNVTTKATNMATSSFQDFIKLPVVGWFIEGIDGMINFVKDPKKGVEKIAAFMNNIIPGSGELLLKAGGAIFGAAKWIMDKGGAILKWTGNVIGNIGKAFSEENKSLIEIEKGVRGSDTGSVDATTGADKSVKPPAKTDTGSVDAITGADKSVQPPAKKEGFFSKLKKQILSGMESANKKSTNFKEEQQARSQQIGSGFGFSGSGGSGGSGDTSSSGGSNIKATDLNSLKKSIKHWEGLRLHAYEDSFGTSIGYGHFLGAGLGGLGKTITKEEADKLFEQDFQKAYADTTRIPNFGNAPFPAQAAMVDMTYNMGPGWIKKFGKPGGTIEAISKGDYVKAANNISKTAYHSQVGPRAEQNIQRFLEASGQGGGGSSNAVFTPTSTKPIEAEQVCQPTSSANLPTAQVMTPTQTTGMEKIDLSDSTIRALASAIGISFKDAIPSPGPNQVSIDTSMRG